jgi:hypothetical protein
MDEKPNEYSVTGYLVTHSPWGGFSTRTKVEVVGETPKRYRIRALTKTRLAGRMRYLEPGATVLVPKHAVRDNCQRCDGEKGGTPGNENVIDGIVTCDYCHAALLEKRAARLLN